MIRSYLSRYSCNVSFCVFLPQVEATETQSMDTNSHQGTEGVASNKHLSSNASLQDTQVSFICFGKKQYYISI